MSLVRIAFIVPKERSSPALPTTIEVKKRAVPKKAAIVQKAKTPKNRRGKNEVTKKRAKNALRLEREGSKLSDKRTEPGARRTMNLRLELAVNELIAQCKLQLGLRSSGVIWSERDN